MFISTKEELNLLFPLHNFSSFQSNLITGHIFFGLRLHQMASQKPGVTVEYFYFAGGFNLIFADFADST